LDRQILENNDERKEHMKTVTKFIYPAMFVFACAALSPLAQAQDSNTAFGFEALFSNRTGESNTAIGYQALFSNTTGDGNTATGFAALFSNTIGEGNTALGYAALFTGSGDNNTAIGLGALQSNNGNANTATGVHALFSNTTGEANTATGSNALLNNTNGIKNTANGFNALLSNTLGQGNTAIGFNALKSNTTAFNNTADGQGALSNNTTGGLNIAVGFQAGLNLTTGSNNIDIGNAGVAGEANTVRIGKSGTQTKTFIAGIRGVTLGSGIGVIVGSNDQLGTVTSSARFKEAIKPMDTASEAILALQPVTFRYKHELDPDGIPQFGLVAEQVEKVNPDLVARDAGGRVNTVRYEAVNAMLLNEFLKEHREVEALKATAAQQQQELQSTLCEHEQQVAELTSRLNKLETEIAGRESQ